MANPSLIIGDGNWAVKSDSLLGYKVIDSKYYPREFTVTRATTGTRVNAAGLVEVVPYNLALWSEQFDNAGWLTTGVVVSSNVEISPSGKLNADKLAPLSSNTIRSFNLIPISNNTTYTWSLYVKNAGARYIQFTAWTSDDPVTVYDLDLVSIYNEAGPAHTSTIQDVGNGWRRITITRTSTSTSAWVLLRPLATPITAPNNGIDGTYVWGAQLVEGTQPLTYLPTTDRLDIPRIDYSTGSAALLVEPQRTNLVTYSEEFNDPSWVNTATIVTSNSTTAPNGLLTADTLVATASNSSHFLGQNVSVTTGTTLVFSCYVKNNGGNFVQLVAGAIGFTINNPYQNFNLINGTLAQGNIPTSTIENVGNGWYRLTCTLTTTSTGVASFFIAPILNSTTGRLNSFTGDGINGIYVWGSQLEAGSYATSYIPTTSASVTRNADSVSKTGISSLIGQTEGTIFLNMNNLAINSDWLTLNPISGSPYTNSIGIGYFANLVRLQIYSPSGTAFGTIASISGNNKIALGYKSGDTAMYINGVNVFSSSNAFSFNVLLDSITVASQSWLAGSIAANKIYSHSLYTTRLTNSELAQLTTP